MIMQCYQGQRLSPTIHRKVMICMNLKLRRIPENEGEEISPVIDGKFY